ncbi:hypothetical protein J2789_004804 [Variovorax paradoxus]|nr:hypothetical protein [Variovorax paradoxus]
MDQLWDRIHFRDLLQWDAAIFERIVDEGSQA